MPPTPCSPWRLAALALSLLGASGARAQIFADVAAPSGLDFVHFNGMSGEYYFPEMTGAGAALFDYDGDGDLDAYLVQGQMMGPDKELSQALIPPRYPAPLTDRLYRNDLTLDDQGRPRLVFTDVTTRAGLAARGYGMGVATGDFDNDGDVDLYVTNFGSNQMLRNNGDGTFSDATAATGTDDSRWSVSAAFLDYDRDGWLDLYVGNYVDFSYSVHKVCSTATGTRDYCGPLAYAPLPDRLFRNRGDGTFADVSARSGIQSEPGSALGVITSDFDADGWVDLYVANDQMANFLWLNQHDGTFRDDGLLAGCAVSAEGKPQASMGVDVGDFDGDGDDDLFMTHLTGESNTLYINDGHGVFHDRSLEYGLANPSWTFTAFGTGFLDYDNDGWLDLVVANGAVKTIEEEARLHDPYPLHQTNQLFRNLQGTGFAEVTAEAGAVFALSEVSRGVALGDLDNDGDTDVLVTNNAGPARLLLNLVGQDAGWAGLRVVDGGRGRDAIGARVAVRAEGGPPRWRRVHTEGSYASANDPRALLGLGAASRLGELRVEWPDGRVEVWRDPPARRYLTLREVVR